MKRYKLDKEKFKVPCVRRKGALEGVMELNPVLKETKFKEKPEAPQAGLSPHYT